MDFTRRLSLPTLLCVLSFGCSGSDAPPSQAAGGSSGSTPDGPIATAAYDFLDAVFKNDFARASQRLTPQAIQNLDAQDQRFSWGSDATKLEIGEVRKISETEAAVQCLVTESAEAGTEELLCILRNVQGQWRVSQIVGEGPQNGEPVVMNFEAPATRRAAPPAAPADGSRYSTGPAPQIPGLNIPPGGSPQTAAGQDGSVVR